MSSSKPKTPHSDDARPLTTEPDSHVRMRKRSATDRAVAAISAQYRAGELSLDEAVAQVKELAAGPFYKVLTADKAAELKEIVDHQVDYDDLIERLRAIGQRK